jgi:hypothetical protein
MKLIPKRILSCEARTVATILEAARTATNSLLATATISLRSSTVEGDRRRSMAAGNQRIIYARSYRQYVEEVRAPAGSISGRGGVSARAATKQARRAKSASDLTERANPQ